MNGLEVAPLAAVGMALAVGLATEMSVRNAERELARRPVGDEQEECADGDTD